MAIFLVAGLPRLFNSLSSFAAGKKAINVVFTQETKKKG
jgi:hypothetical protein